MIDVSVLQVRPHPDQTTNNPGCWAVQLRVTRADQSRTFWRWHTVRRLDQRGVLVEPDNVPPSSDEILAWFWDDTFGDLHGFNFERLIGATSLKKTRPDE